MKNLVFEGAATAIITPFNDDMTVNYEEFGRIIDFQLDEGINAIVVCGTTGEASTLDDDEHKEVMRYCINRVAGRVPVICGTGSNDTAYAIALTKAAKDMGAAASLQVTPYYNKTSQKGLIAHFTAIADAVDLPMILYNVPSRTGMSISPQTYKELSKHPNIVAVKEASGNMPAIATAMELCKEDLVFYSGNDNEIISLMSLGAKGVISVLADVKPAQTAKMCRLALDGDFAAAAKLQLDYMPLINALFSDVNPIPVKEAMSIIGFNAGPCRLPLYKLDDDKAALLKSLL